MKSPLATNDGSSLLSRLLPLTIIPGVFVAIFVLSDEKLVPIVGFVLTSTLGLFLVFSRSDVAVAQGPAADERQEHLNKMALLNSHYAVVGVALIGFFLEVVRGEAGPFTLICFVAGSTHIGSLLYLRRRM